MWGCTSAWAGYRNHRLKHAQEKQDFLQFLNIKEQELARILATTYRKLDISYCLRCISSNNVKPQCCLYILNVQDSSLGDLIVKEKHVLNINGSINGNTFVIPGQNVRHLDTIKEVSCAVQSLKLTSQVHYFRCGEHKLFIKCAIFREYQPIRLIDMYTLQ